jgi:hypothetical protein
LLGTTLSCNNIHRNDSLGRAWGAEEQPQKDRALWPCGPEAIIETRAITGSVGTHADMHVAAAVERHVEVIPAREPAAVHSQSPTPSALVPDSGTYMVR